ncbi:hemagglutinin-like [Diplodia corticola]|uniref:Hemagglutinin-like n=1 Tax=Diplodia corticola TaxID=236234 RepID=A0A1J9SLZ0_9PEZI|nr:hemagglutinin-like [Diplodia corticola]OJD40740.1 hemagglutinin-like [Diplodia corticola]
MHSVSLLVPALAGGVLGFALPEPNVRHIPPHNARLGNKAITKHVIIEAPCEDDYYYHGGLQTTAYAVFPGSSSPTQTFVVTTVETIAPSDDPLDTPDVDFLPEVADGFYFDEYLDDFYGFYDFSDTSFSATLQDFAPGLSSYDTNVFDEDDLPQFVTIGGQLYSTVSQFYLPPNINAILPRSPQQLPALDPKNFASIQDLLEEIAIRQETEREYARLVASQSPPKQPPSKADALNAPGIAMLQRQSIRDEIIARRESEKAAKAIQAGQASAAVQASASAAQAEREAAAAQSKANAAAAAAATGDTAKSIQITLDRKTLPILPGTAAVQSDGKAEPLVIGKKVAEAAAGTISKDADKLKQVQDQAKSAAQKAQAAAPKPTGLISRAINATSPSGSGANPMASNNGTDFTSVISALVGTANQQQNLDASSTPDFSYSTISDVTGGFFLAADDSGTLGLTAEAPTADAFAWKTFALFKGALAADARSRLFVFFPATMDALGVSRFRLAALNETSFDARAAAVIPVNVGGDGAVAGSVLVPVDAEGGSYAFVACDVAVDGVVVNKLFVVADQDAGIKTLLETSTQDQVTGGVANDCFPVSLKSPLSAGL